MARMVAANHIPPLSDEITSVPVEARPTMSEVERQTALLEKLDLSQPGQLGAHRSRTGSESPMRVP